MFPCAQCLGKTLLHLDGIQPRFCVRELAGICIVLRTNKLKCNAVAHLLHRNVKATSEEKSSRFSKPSGLSKTGNLLRGGRFGVCAYTCTSRALHLACLGQSQNPGSVAGRTLLQLKAVDCENAFRN